MNGQNISKLAPHLLVDTGIGLVPEGRGNFAELTVRENLLLGAYPKRGRAREKEMLDLVLSLFPRIEERLSQQVRTMSGGEQQMVAIGRVLMSAPDILLLDEPSLGLSPLMTKELFRALVQVRDRDRHSSCRTECLAQSRNQRSRFSTRNWTGRWRGNCRGTAQ